MQPGLYGVCQGCEQSTRGELLTPVQVPHIKFNYSETQWLCPTCKRKMRRTEHGDEDVSQHDRQ